jgi:hypothetical protein
MGEESQKMIGILSVILPTVVFGGVSLLTMLMEVDH